MFQKTLIYLGLVEEPDEYAERDGGGFRSPAHQETLRDPREPRETPASRDPRDQMAPSGMATHGGPSNVQPLRRSEPGSAHVRPMNRTGMGARVQIVAVQDFERGAEEIGRQYRMGSPVLFDLADAPTPDARRILDFVAGVTFALRGRMEKMGPRAFLMTPDQVDLTPDERARLAGLGYGG